MIREKIKALCLQYGGKISDESTHDRLICETKKIRAFINELLRTGLIAYRPLRSPGESWSCRVSNKLGLAPVGSVLYAFTLIIRLPQKEEQRFTDMSLKDIIKEKLNAHKDNQVENQVMQNKKTYKQEFLSDLEKMAYRQGASKATNLGHTIILWLFHEHCNFDGSKLQVLMEVLESPFGKALLSYGMGKAVQQIPGDSKVVENMAEEFRIAGLNLGAEAGLEKLMEADFMALGTSFMAAVKTVSEGNILESIKAWKAVEAAVPQKVRIAMESMSRIHTETIKVPKPQPKIEEMEIELDDDEPNTMRQVMHFGSEYASCS